jgi:hypothetical protein
MPRPCTCDRLPPPGEPYSPQYCVRCWLWHNEPAYRAHHQGAGGPRPPNAPGGPAPAPRAAACRHRGAAVREQQCPPCGGNVRLKVFACALYRECTPATALPGLACCATCPDYDPGGNA